MNIIECHDICKDFRGNGEIIHALEQISFSVPQGKITGILGPDGSGKTTLLRILCGLLRPDGGRVSVMGYDSVSDAKKIQARVGYMPQKFGLYETLTIAENLELYADLHQIPRNIRIMRENELLSMTGLSRFRSRRAGALSGGMKQKLALICALISSPELLILDEPTIGVDVLSRRELWEILLKLTRQGAMSVAVSTAYMDEANYCDSTIVMLNGKILANHPPANIRAMAKPFVSNPSFENGFQVLMTGNVPPPLERTVPFLLNAPVMIHAENLVKKFGKFTAVKGISFEVRKGEIFGLLGANGAGKTTTFRMLCGLSAADEGSVQVAGISLRNAPDKARNRIGYMAQKFSLYQDISVLDNLLFFGEAYGLHSNALRERIDWAMEQFELKQYRNSCAGKLPLGFKQRLSMACAMLHQPDILFLDEATSGADPLARREFWQRIIEAADSGIAVIITTHFLDEAAYCDRMMIMQDGDAAAQGSASEILTTGTIDGKVPCNLEEAFVNVIQLHREKQL